MIIRKRIYTEAHKYLNSKNVSHLFSTLHINNFKKEISNIKKLYKIPLQSYQTTARQYLNEAYAKTNLTSFTVKLTFIRQSHEIKTSFRSVLNNTNILNKSLNLINTD